MLLIYVHDVTVKKKTKKKTEKKNFRFMFERMIVFESSIL